MAFTSHTVGPDGLVTETAMDWQDVLDHNKSDLKPNLLKQRPRKDSNCYAILTQTVLESTTARWILPLRLRRESDYDVAFVGEYSLRVCELSDRFCDLIELVGETDFRSRIVHASLLDGGEDEIPNSFTPPRIVLVLENGTMVFVMVSMELGSAKISITFQESTIPAASEPSAGAMQFTICPYSRHLAMSCIEGQFTVCELGTTDDQHCQIVALRHFRLKGTILKIAFLHGPEIYRALTTLVLLVAHGGRSKLCLYRWSNTDELLKCRKEWNSLPDQQYRMPLLLIPIKFKFAFALVFDDKILVCRVFIRGEIEWEIVDMNPRPATSLYRGLDRPLWVAYTKPKRTKDFAATHDDLYLAREDGVVIFIEIEADYDGDFEIREMLAGVLDCRVGSAFTRLGYPDASANDILAVGGDGEDGAIYEMIPRTAPPKFVCAIPNSAHLMDAIAAPDFTELTESDAESIESVGFTYFPKILTLMGKDTEEPVRVLRYGYEARPYLEINCAGRAITSIWAYIEHGHDQDGPIVLASSSPRKTTMPLQDDFLVETIDGVASERARWIDTSNATSLFAASESMAVQVTGCRYLVKLSSNQVFNGSFDGIIQALATHDGFMLVVYHAENNTFLALIHAGAGGLWEVCRTLWSDEHVHLNPSMAVLRQLVGEEHMHCFISNGRHLYVFEVNVLLRHIRRVSRISIGERDLAWYTSRRGEAWVCTALHVFQDHKPRSAPFVLVGTQDANLFGMQLSDTLQEAIPDTEFEASLGTTSVTFNAQDMHTDQLVIKCDDKLYGANYNRDVPFLWTFAPIWMNGQADNDGLDFAAYPGGVVIHKDQTLYICSMSWQARPMPWTVQPVPDPKPTRRVACTTGSMLRTGERSYKVDIPIQDMHYTSRSSRSVRRMIYMIDPGNTSGTVSYISSSALQLMQVTPPTFSKSLQLRPLCLGETRASEVFCIAPWTNENRSAIIYGQRGRVGVYYLSPPSLQNLNVDGCVTALTTFENFIIAGVDSTLQLFLASEDEVRFGLYDVCHLPEPSIIRNIETWVENGFWFGRDTAWIDVLTSEQSLYRFKMPNVKEDFKLRPLIVDSVKREDMSSIHERYPASEVTLVSDRSSCVSGAHQSRHGTQIGESYTAFEAETPWPITKFIKAHSRPPWTGRDTLDPTILGTTLAGAIIAFDIINKTEYRWISRLQALIQSSKILCPNTCNLPRKRIPNHHPLSRHLDGDVLRRAAGPGKLRLLMETHEDQVKVDEIREVIRNIYPYITDEEQRLRLCRFSLERLLEPQL